MRVGPTLLARLVALAKNNDDRNQWMRQMIDSIASAVQIGAFPGGLERLKTLETQFAHRTGKSPLVPYVAYRRLLADYTTQQKATTTTPSSKTSKSGGGTSSKIHQGLPHRRRPPEAMLQLAIAYEFASKMPEARSGTPSWPRVIPTPGPATARPEPCGVWTSKASRCSSPVRRSTGTFDAKAYRGRVLLVAYWSTWCTVCTQDVPVLKDSLQAYRDQGLEIVGVNLDVTAAAHRPLPRGSTRFRGRRFFSRAERRASRPWRSASSCHP